MMKRVVCNLSPQFNRFSVSERLEFISSNKFYLKCLCTKFCVKRCRAQNCVTCEKPHNSTLHFKKGLKNENPSIALQTGNESVFNDAATSFFPNQKIWQLRFS